jgi:phage repressor protein C with HTH and peptisase S24 domain
MENIGQRIKQLRKMLGLSQREFAEKIGKSLNAVQKWESGDRIPSEPALKLIAKEFNVNEEWLKTGEGEMFLEVPTKEEEGIKIPFYPEATLSAGEGLEVVSEEHFWVEISPDLMLKLIGVVYRRGLTLLPIYGDSMEPTLKSGSVVMVRLWEYEHNLINGAIYAFRVDGDLFVKRVEIDPVNKVITFKSDNPNYSSFQMKREELDRVQIIGRVLIEMSGVY